MKCRSGWVSNSSSSSFIISTKNKDNLKIMVEMDLSKVTEYTIKTKEDLDKYIKEEHCWGDYSVESVLNEEEYLKEEYEEILKALENGEVVYKVSGSSEDYDPVGSFIYNNGLKESENIHIISGEY